MREKYLVEGKIGKVVIAFTTTTYDSAVRGGKAVLKENENLQSVAVKDHKGNVLKVLSRGKQ